jgi:hypothetical protein
MSSRFEHDQPPTIRQECRRWPFFTLWISSALLLLLSWPATVEAMRPDRVAQLRQETVEMFYHGFDNYMAIAFPEDEVCYTAAAQGSFELCLSSPPPPS